MTLPCVLVISSGRCGSTLVSDMVRQHRDILSVSEYFSCIGVDAFGGPEVTGVDLLRLMVTPLVGPTLLVRHNLEMDEYIYPFDGGARYTRATGVPPVSLTTLPHLTDDPDGLLDEVTGFLRSQPSRPIADQHRRLFEFLAGLFGRSLWVERSGGSSGHAAALLRAFPDARVIHLYRDGPATARSMARHTGMRMTLLGSDLARRVGIDPFSRRLGDLPPCPDEQLRGVWPDSFTADGFLGYPLALERFGMAWSMIVGRGARELAKLPTEQVMNVSYEELASSPAAVAARMASFLGVEASAVWLRDVVGLVRPRADRDVQDDPALQGACRPGKERLRRLLEGVPVELTRDRQAKGEAGPAHRRAHVGVTKPARRVPRSSR
jgi:hypothetical protein